MGFSRFSGPVYGSKSLLKTLTASSGNQNTSTAIAWTNASFTVPQYEDWYITEVCASISTCSSGAHALSLKCEGGSTTIPINQKAPGNGSTRAATITTFSPINPNSTSTTAAFTRNTITPDAGESEGFWVPAGSSIRLVSSGASGPGIPVVDVYGYIRWRDSSNRGI